MRDHEEQGPGPTVLLRKLAQTGLGALRNRGELLLVELQEEKERLVAAFVWTAALLFSGFMGVMLLTATVIFLFPEAYRLWAAGGFAVLYLGGAVASVFIVKGLLKETPFAETIEQVRKDGEWLETLN
jgi:uncharacterized membrane protein YqjE